MLLCICIAICLHFASTTAEILTMLTHLYISKYIRICTDSYKKLVLRAQGHHEDYQSVSRRPCRGTSKRVRIQNTQSRSWVPPQGRFLGTLLRSSSSAYINLNPSQIPMGFSRVCLCVRMCVWLCMYIFIHTHTYRHTCTHTHHEYSRKNIHIHTYTYWCGFMIYSSQALGAKYAITSVRRVCASWITAFIFFVHKYRVCKCACMCVPYQYYYDKQPAKYAPFLTLVSIQTHTHRPWQQVKRHSGFSRLKWFLERREQMGWDVPPICVYACLMSACMYVCLAIWVTLDGFLERRVQMGWDVPPMCIYACLMIACMYVCLAMWVTLAGSLEMRSVTGWDAKSHLVCDLWCMHTHKQESRSGTARNNAMGVSLRTHTHIHTYRHRYLAPAHQTQPLG